MTVPLARIGREKFTDHRLATQCRECQWLDELFGVRGHDNLNLGTRFHQQAGESGALIGSDAASDAQDDVLAFQHNVNLSFRDGYYFFLYWIYNLVMTCLVFSAKSLFIIQS